MILEISPQSSALVRAGAATLLFLHISGGSIGLLAGAGALWLKKGGRAHRIVGNAFVIAMLVMAAIGAGVAPFLHARLDVIVAIFTCYLVATGWMTVHRKAGTIGRFERGAAIVAFGAVLACLIFGIVAITSASRRVGGFPPTAYAFLGTLIAIAAAGDVHLIRHGGVSGTARIARHLWRMCLALLIATSSFFLGQQQFLPQWMRGSAWAFVPVLAVIGALVFWLIKVRFGARFKWPGVQAPATAGGDQHSS